jgi:transposase
MKKYSTIVGMDLGDKYCYWARMSAESEEIVEESRVRTSQPALKRLFSSMEPARVAIEVGTHSPWIGRLLEECGHEVLIGNARKLRMIYTNEKKDDREDARMLARVARMDPQLLAPITHRGAQAQADLAVLQARDALVRSRSALISHARGIVKPSGERLPKCSPESFHRKAAEVIPEALRPALEPLFHVIGELSARICAYDKAVEERCARYVETALFREVSGVGPLTALAYALIIEQPERFAKSREVAAYVGLVPRRSQSGESNPQLRITKSGNAYLRRLLVGAAQYILGPFNRQDSELRQWGLRLAGPVNKQGKHNKWLKRRAVVAVARKLAVLLHRLWVTGEIYDPEYQQSERKTVGCAA